MASAGTSLGGRLYHWVRTTFPGLRKFVFFLRFFRRIEHQHLLTCLYGRAPLNEQRLRRKVVDALLTRLPFGFLVETGTFVGNTTAYLAGHAARLGARLDSCDTNEFFLNFAAGRLRDQPGVHLHLQESGEMLPALSETIGDALAFVYLDAHYFDAAFDEDVPIKRELAVVGAWPRAVVLIDDFRVPGDPSFEYDDYGAAGSLCLEFLAAELAGYRVFFPAHRAGAEGGMPRGYVLATRCEEAAAVLADLPELREYRG